MKNPDIKRLDRALAGLCRFCPACRHAREKRDGVVFRLVKSLESGICPFCRAYEKVYGRKAHVPVPLK